MEARLASLERRVAALEKLIRDLSINGEINLNLADYQDSNQGSGVDPTVLDLIQRNRKIEAIKAQRELTGWGLKQAKEYVDDLEARLQRGDL